MWYIRMNGIVCQRSRLRSQIDKVRIERDRESKKYLRLWKAVRKEFGDEKAWELIEKAEE